MSLFKNTRVDRKYILIVVILVAIVGGGILGYTKQSIKEIISLSQFLELNA